MPATAMAAPPHFVTVSRVLQEKNPSSLRFGLATHYSGGRKAIAFELAGCGDEVFGTLPGGREVCGPAGG
jgi:hypothetical protein